MCRRKAAERYLCFCR